MIAGIAPEAGRCGSMSVVSPDSGPGARPSALVRWLRASLTWAELAVLTVVLTALFSFDFERLTPSSAFIGDPVGWVLLAFVVSLLFGAFTAVSRWSGWKQWSAIFLVLYGVPYVLTVAEAPYIPTVLPESRVIDTLLNGAIIAGVFATAVVVILGRPGGEAQPSIARLSMPPREWAWKILVAGAIYLALFFVFGAAVYGPIARMMDPSGYAAEQGAIPASGSALVFPIEFLRGIGFAAFSLLAVVALPSSWKKTGVAVALLIAIPESAMILLSTTMAPGLVPGHFVEVLGANLIFGYAVVWLLNRPGRLTVVLAGRPHAVGSPT